MKAVRDDEDAATAMGINTLKQKLLPFRLLHFLKVWEVVY